MIPDFAKRGLPVMRARGKPDVYGAAAFVCALRPFRPAEHVLVAPTMQVTAQCSIAGVSTRDRYVRASDALRTVSSTASGKIATWKS